jgi:hypothetical protein
VPKVQNKEKVAPISIMALTRPWSFLEKNRGNNIRRLTAPIIKPIIIKNDDFTPCF